MDWTKVPTSTGGDIDVSTWSGNIEELHSSTRAELPAIDRSTVPNNVVTFTSSGEMVEFTQANLVAGIAGQLTSIPNTQRITNADIFLPADSLTSIYTLVLTLSALFSNASVALNSVGSKNPDLVYATQGISPTIVAASSSTLAKYHVEATARMNSLMYRLIHWSQRRSLVQNGVMPLATVFSRFYDSRRPVVGTTPSKLRLIYVVEHIGSNSTPLSAEILTDLRIYLGARIIYALASPQVAGAVTQTSPFDYRVDEAEERAHFGAPVSSVEILFRDTKTDKTTDDSAAGEVKFFYPRRIRILY